MDEAVCASAETGAITTRTRKVITTERMWHLMGESRSAIHELPPLRQ
jgi:hypothetical protein